MSPVNYERVKRELAAGGTVMVAPEIYQQLAEQSGPASETIFASFVRSHGLLPERLQACEGLEPYTVALSYGEGVIDYYCDFTETLPTPPMGPEMN